MERRIRRRKEDKRMQLWNAVKLTTEGLLAICKDGNDESSLVGGCWLRAPLWLPCVLWWAWFCCGGNAVAGCLQGQRLAGGWGTTQQDPHPCASKEGRKGYLQAIVKDQQARQEVKKRPLHLICHSSLPSSPSSSLQPGVHLHSSQ